MRQASKRFAVIASVLLLALAAVWFQGRARSAPGESEQQGISRPACPQESPASAAGERKPDQEPLPVRLFTSRPVAVLVGEQAVLDLPMADKRTTIHRCEIQGRSLCLVRREVQPEIGNDRRLFAARTSGPATIHTSVEINGKRTDKSYDIRVFEFGVRPCCTVASLKDVSSNEAKNHLYVVIGQARPKTSAVSAWGRDTDTDSWLLEDGTGAVVINGLPQPAGAESVGILVAIDFDGTERTVTAIDWVQILGVDWKKPESSQRIDLYRRFGLIRLTGDRSFTCESEYRGTSVRPLFDDQRDTLIVRGVTQSVLVGPTRIDIYRRHFLAGRFDSELVLESTGKQATRPQSRPAVCLRLFVTSDSEQAAKMIDKLEEAVRNYQRTNSSLPASLDDLDLPADRRIDPWGMPFRLELATPRLRKAGLDYRIVSAGLDRQFGTKDDLPPIELLERDRPRELDPDAPPVESIDPTTELQELN